MMSFDYIFGRGTSSLLDFREIDFQYSRKTGRIRHILDKNTHVVLFTFRPNGSVAPTTAGASRLLSNKRIQRKIHGAITSRPRWTITVSDGVSEVVSKGGTVFCKHVVHCDDSLCAGEDLAVLNEKGKLLAAGRAILAGPLIKQFKKGAAVKVREGTEV